MSTEVLNFIKSTIDVQTHSWIIPNLAFLTYTGSKVYGCQTDMSDDDILGFSVPNGTYLRSIYDNEIYKLPDFSIFEQHQQDHKKFQDKEYDFSIYNFLKYIWLCRDANPNIVASLFIDEKNWLLCTPIIKELIIDNRHVFLSKKAKHRFNGYLDSQLAKIKHGTNSENPKRQELINNYGYDTKFASHAVRLSLDCIQILEEGNLDLERNAQLLLDVRAGKFSIEDIHAMCSDNKAKTNVLYETSKLIPEVPRDFEIRNLVYKVLEAYN